MSLDVFAYSDFASLLEAYKQSPPGKKRPLSLAKMAKILGYNSPRILAMVMKGQRKPSERMIEVLGESLKLNSVEKRFVDLLAFKARRSDRNKTDRLDAEIKQFQKNKISHNVLDLETFRFVADWQHYVIKNLVARKDFTEDPAWITQQIRWPLSHEQVRESIEIMLKLGILIRSKHSRLKVASKGRQLLTQPDLSSISARKHHAHMMQRAVDALVSIAPVDREVSSLTARVNRESMPEAKKMIRSFVDEFNRRFSDSDSNSIYQLNIQFFEHTKS